MDHTRSTQAAAQKPFANEEVSPNLPPLTEDLELPRYSIDLPAFDKIHQAIEAKDEASLWQQLGTSSDPAVFMDWIGNAATGLVREICHPRDKRRVVREHHSLFVLPVVVGPAAVDCDYDDADRRRLFDAVRESVQAWFGGGTTEVRIYSALFDYAELSCWTPCQVYARVEELAGMARRTPVRQAKRLRLGPNTPRLLFLVGSAQRTFGSPEFPEENFLEDTELTAKVKGTLSLLSQSAESVLTVGLPEVFTDGVRNGLAQFVELLREGGDIRSWSLVPVEIDAVDLVLNSAEPADCCQLPVRLHHIGLHGLDLLVQRLESLPKQESEASALAH